MNCKFFILLLFYLISCNIKSGEPEKKPVEIPFYWNNATVYFLLTDRFYNADTTNDFSFGRKQDGAPLRSFAGGDIKGIIKKLEDGYFDDLGVNAIWFSPPFEQIHGPTDEGTGQTYGYHGYWIRDWTAIDPNFGTMEELRELVRKAHSRGIRILLDAVINHTGPVTDLDSQWPDSWVRTGPVCTYTGYQSTVTCTLVKNLPDIRTDSDIPVELPDFLIAKWKEEGRLEQELNELDDFFTRTGYPRAPRYYIIKWLTDFVRELGIDGFRVDTAKHTEASVWDELKKESISALREWKINHPAEKPDNLDFYMVGEVYGYGPSSGRFFNFGDSIVDFFDHGFNSLINFQFKSDAMLEYEELFSHYSEVLNGNLKGVGLLNYLSSHDDGDPFDKTREKVLEAGTKLLLSPGTVQIYFGDETARPLIVDKVNGDANMRSIMNWDDLENNESHGGIPVSDILTHWQKLGKFRKEHPAVGMGTHRKLEDAPLIFTRSFEQNGTSDRILVIMGNAGQNIEVKDIFPDDAHVKDYYSGEIYLVKNGEIKLRSANDLILLGIPPNHSL